MYRKCTRLFCCIFSLCTLHQRSCSPGGLLKRDRCLYIPCVSARLKERQREKWSGAVVVHSNQQEFQPASEQRMTVLSSAAAAKGPHPPQRTPLPPTPILPSRPSKPTEGKEVVSVFVLNEIEVRIRKRRSPRAASRAWRSPPPASSWPPPSPPPSQRRLAPATPGSRRSDPSRPAP